MCNKYSFDSNKSILLGDYLDLLLNATGQRMDVISSDENIGLPKVGDGSKHTETKFIKYEKIIYANDNDRRLTELRFVSEIREKDQTVTSNPPSGLHTDEAFRRHPAIASTYDGGILLPNKKDCPEKINKNDDGSGNIVIIGEPGVGKSTLAFQIAAECTSTFNDGIAVYYSIDINRSQLIKSMCKNEDSLSPDAIIRRNRMISPQNQDSNDSDEHLLAAFKSSLNQQNGKIVPQILFPMFSPRGISHNAERAQELFNKRFAELELMLRAVSVYNQEIKQCQTDNPMVKIIVIDSINTLGEMPLTREQIGRVFELFENYGIIGLFTLGENTSQTDTEAVNSSTIRYIADVVIHMRREEHNNYACMSMTVEKSRYVKPLIGAHPYKIMEVEQTRIPGNNLDIHLKKYVNVMPTLHDIIPGTEKGSGEEKAKQQDSSTHSSPAVANEHDMENLFGITALSVALPDAFNSRKGNSTKTITLAGESGLFKSDLSVNALINGILEDKPQTGLIIRMSDRDNFANGGVRLEESVIKKLLEKCNASIDFTAGKTNEVIIKMKTIDPQARDNPVKRIICGWTLSGVSVASQPKPTQSRKHAPDKAIITTDQPHSTQPEGNNYKPPKDHPISGPDRKLLEITFKSGALLPEEFISDILMLVIKHDVKRIAFNDIKYIGTSYPFLVDSGTSGTLFISAFIHIMRNYGVDVIMSSSTCGYKPSNDEMKKAVVLSDAVLNFNRDKLSDFNVKVTGEGQMINNQHLRIDVLDKGTSARPDIDCTFEISDHEDDTSPIHSAKLKAFRIVEVKPSIATKNKSIPPENILRILERLLSAVQSSKAEKDKTTGAQP